MRLSRILAGAATGALMLGAATTVQAQEATGPFELTGLVTLTSDYRFRGISQTQEDPAIQGGLTANHESGFFVGVWGSSVDFAGSDTWAELDLIAGYTNTVGSLTYIAQALYYVYPEESDFNYAEFNLGFSLETGTGFTPSLNVWYAPDLPGDLENLYVTAGGTFAVTDAVSVFANYGKSFIEGPGNYADWNAGVAFEFQGFTFDVRYVDTDIKGSDLADERIVGSVTYSF
jgi:uncharacterized protein (TIGR02001 family)